MLDDHQSRGLTPQSDPPSAHEGDDMNEATAKRTRAKTCIGCGLPLFGFTIAPYTDRYGDVYHSRACYERSEREMAELDR